MPQQFLANCGSTELVDTNTQVAIRTSNRADALRTRKSHFAAASLCTAIGAVILCLSAATATRAQDIVLPGGEPPVVDHGGAPVSDFGGGSFFSQDLGTILRLRYNTESYGQDHHGNFDIGTMQVVNLDDSTVFFDGQLTMNEAQGVGYNLGAGYRRMHFPAFSHETGRIAGASLWTDGTSTDEGGFFPQIGLSLESLGDLWDFRSNGYLPLGPQDQMGEFESTGQTDFLGSSIAELTQAVVNSSYAVAEAEAARRLGSERDAWAFAGPYFVANDDDDAAGFRAGVRGYAYPDLFVQVAVSDDEIFKTNASFSVVWFVGRTRTDFHPACGVPDRFREPVLRNDYVALSQSFVQSGEPLTQPDGSALRIVHVDSTAAPGGDGTFENPFDMLTDVNGAGSQEGDIILAHAQSVFTGEGTTMLKLNQRLLGEGDGFVHTVATAEQGTFAIPETAPGARDATRPLVNASVADAVILAASGNEGTNFDFLDINGNAISGTGLTGNVTLRELDVTNGTDFAISLVDVATTSTVTLDEFTYDGGAGTAGGLELLNFDGTLNATDGTLTNGTQAGIRIAANGADDSDGTFTFASTFTIDSVDNAGGAAFEVEGFTGVATMNGTIDNDIGRAVSVQDMGTTGVVTFSATADITHTTTGANSEGVFITNNADGTVAFNGDLILTTNGSIAFHVDEVGNDVLLTAPSANNSINTTNATGLRIVGAEIGAAGVNFPELNATGGVNGAVLMNNTAAPTTTGPITLGLLGNDAGESGTIAATGDGIVIDNSANVTASGFIINNTAGDSGVLVNKTTTGNQTVNLNDLQINDGGFGVETTGNGTGQLTMTINDSEIFGSTDAGISINNIDTGPIQINNTLLDGNNANATQDGIRITGSNAQITVDINPASDDTIIREFGDNEFEVDDGSPNVTMNGAIVNTSGRSVLIHRVDGGSVTFTANSSIDDDGAGMLIGGAVPAEGNTGGVFSFLGTNEFDTTTNDAVTVSNNSGAMDVIFEDLDINTTSGDGVVIEDNTSTTSVLVRGVDVNTTMGGRGFVATDGGDLTVTGANNVITTTGGTGLIISGMNIVTEATFEEVSVSAGTANGIVLQNVTGAQVTVGETGGADGDGGILDTDGDAIILTNIANVDLLNVQVTNASNAGAQGVNIDHDTNTNMDVTLTNLDVLASAGLGMEVVHTSANQFDMRINGSTLAEQIAMDFTGSGELRLLVDDTNVTTSGTDFAFDINFSGSAADGDVTIRNTSTFTAVDAPALLFTVDGAGRNIEANIDNNTFVNNSATARPAELRATGGAVFNANVVNNTFTNPGAGEELLIQSDTGATVNLNIVNNGPMGSQLRLQEAGASTFNVVNLATADGNNPGDIIFDPNMAAFTDIPPLSADQTAETPP